MKVSYHAILQSSEMQLHLSLAKKKISELPSWGARRRRREPGGGPSRRRRREPEACRTSSRRATAPLRTPRSP